MNTFKVPPHRRFVRESRPLDFIYDPIYTIPSRVDFYKNADYGSRHGESKLKLQTNFDVMFSDIKTHQRIQGCMQVNRPDYAQKFMPKYELGGLPVAPMDTGPPYFRDDDVTGAERAKYFIRYAPPEVTQQSYQLAPAQIIKTKQVEVMKRDVGSEPEYRDRGVQTDLREMETQTDPYSPPYVLPSPDDYPMVLALIKMTWGKGLPATLDDIVTIERALTKRMIEIDDRTSLEITKEAFIKRLKLMETLEAQQWEDRERELEKLRLWKQEIVSKRLNELRQRMARDSTLKLERIFEKKKKENAIKLQSIKMDYLRQLRKLERKLSTGKKTFKRDIILDYIDMESSIYTPLVRNGPNVDQLHTVPDYQFTVHRDYETLTYLTDMDSFAKKHMEFNIEDFANRVKKVKPKRKVQLLERKLQDCLTAFKGVCRSPSEGGQDEMLNTMIMKSVRRMSTPEEALIRDDPDSEDEAIVILQTLVRGRAVQSLLRQEARTNMETILALKAAYEKDPYGALQPISEKLALRKQQQQQDSLFAASKDVSEIVEQVEGEVLAHMMSFLEKEMVRLLDERKIHALILLAERERRMLEATEAGRRQKEEECMRANDEIWRQVIGIHQQTVDMYLEDIYLETVNRTGDEEARKYVQQLARTINDAAFVMERNLKDVDKDELSADLVHSFLFPQVKRESVTRQMIDLNGRYYTAATQVTDSLFNAKGFVHQVLRVLQPELTKRLEAGAAVVDASHCVVTNMIHAAVEKVLKREENGQDVRKASLPPPSAVAHVKLPAQFGFDVEGKYRNESRRSFSEHLVSTGAKIRSAISSKSETKVKSPNRTLSAESGQSGEEEEEEEEEAGSKEASQPGSTTSTPQSRSPKQSVEEEGLKGLGPVPKPLEAEVEDEDEEHHEIPLATTASEGTDISQSGDTTEVDEAAGASLPVTPRMAPPSEMPVFIFEEEDFEEGDSTNPKLWNIPIDVPPMLCDLIGLKEMELQSGKLELTETTVKVFDASCTAVEDIFDDVKKSFTVSDEESDHELDDDDPDQD